MTRLAALAFLALSVPLSAAPSPSKASRGEIARAMENRDWAGAKTLLVEALRASPRDVELRLDRAAVADQLGEADLARALLEGVLKEHPGIAARRRAAAIFEELGDADRASAERDSLLRDAPDSAGVRLDRALAAVDWNKNAEAVAELDASLPLTATFDERRLRASLYSRAGASAKARAELKSLARDFPKRREPLLDLAALNAK